MKRKFFVPLTLLFFLLILAGCGQKPTATGAPVGEANPAGQPAPGRPRRPDFGQPQKPAEIRGIVKSIVGNEVTVLKVDMGSRRASSTPSTGSESSSTKATSFSLNGGGANRRMNGGGFGGPGGPEGQGGQNSGTREQMLAKLKELSTGEEVVTIPVGIKMMKPDTSSATGQRQMIEASLTDITADKMITIWLNDAVKDKKVADFVLIN